MRVYDARDCVEWEQPLVERSVFLDAEFHAVARKLVVNARGVGDKVLHDAS